MRRLPPPVTATGPELATEMAQQEALAEIDKGGEALKQFEKACGGRQKFIDALVPQADGSIRDLLAMLQDDRYKGKSLVWIAQTCGLSLTRIMQAYHSGLIYRMHVAATQIVAEKIGPVVEHILDHAIPRELSCPDCNGTGKIDIEKKRTPSNACKACHGVGTRTIEPDLARQKLALDLAQLSPQSKAGPVVQQQFNIGADQPTTVKSSDPRVGGLERLHQALGKVLYEKPLVIDVTPDPTEPK